jgi:hypothetical protein
MKRLKALEEENARLKRIVAQQSLDNELLREINVKNGGIPRVLTIDQFYNEISP